MTDTDTLRDPASLATMMECGDVTICGRNGQPLWLTGSEWDAIIAALRSYSPVTEPVPDLIAKAKEIIAEGCGCDRHCDELVGPDFHCGCETDARAVLALRPQSDLDAECCASMEEIAKLREENEALRAGGWQPIDDDGPKGDQECRASLPALRQAIIDHTKGDLFWIGEILLDELKKETGFDGTAVSSGSHTEGER